MTWVLLIGAVWLTVAALVGVLIGRSIRLADRKSDENAAAAPAPNFVVDLSPPPAVAGSLMASTPDAPGAAAEPVTPDGVRPSIPSARTSAVAPALSAEPPREPGQF
jgi:hypothetical protein